MKRRERLSVNKAPSVSFPASGSALALAQASGPIKAAKKFGFSRQRYFQLRSIFLEKGAIGLVSQQRGPKTNYRRIKEVVCQAIRHRLLDPDASSEVIAQKLRQCGFKISKRSVDRIFAEYGLQKKTLQMSAESETGDD